MRSLEGYIEEYHSDYLKEKSVNGCTHLDDVLHLPFAIQKDKSFADVISQRLFNFLIKKMQFRLRPSDFQKVLGNITRDGFGVLQDALKSGNTEIVRQVIDLLSLPGHAKALSLQLNNFTRDDFGVLQQALASKNTESVKVCMGTSYVMYGDIPFNIPSLSPSL